MTTPTNDAHALHDLLERLISANGSPQDRWADVLDTEFGAPEFARRHAEVLALYTGTLAQIGSLPEKGRVRNEKYAWLWWMAIMAPQHAWSRSVNMHSVLDGGNLDHLASAADVIDGNMRGSLAAPTETDLSDLEEVCREWIDAVIDETDLAEALRLNLLQDLNHIVWLIKHADIFGVARVAAAGQGVIGSVITVGQTLPPTNQGVWWERGKKLVRFIVMLGAIHAGVDTTMMLGGGAFSLVGELSAGSGDVVPAAPGPLNGDVVPESGLDT